MSTEKKSSPLWNLTGTGWAFIVSLAQATKKNITFAQHSVLRYVTTVTGSFLGMVATITNRVKKQGKAPAPMAEDPAPPSIDVTGAAPESSASSHDYPQGAATASTPPQKPNEACSIVVTSETEVIPAASAVSAASPLDCETSGSPCEAHNLLSLGVVDTSPSSMQRNPVIAADISRSDDKGIVAGGVYSASQVRDGSPTSATIVTATDSGTH